MPGPEVAGEAFAGFSLSEDGQRTFLQLATDQPGKFAQLTLPTALVPTLYLQMGVFIDTLIMGDVLPPGVQKPVRTVTRYEVGSNTFSPGFTALAFDRGLTQECMVMMDDLTALKVADAIQQKVFQAMPLNDQKKMLEAVEHQRGGPPTGKAKLIVPPGRR